jgi:hypothetical protein
VDRLSTPKNGAPAPWHTMAIRMPHRTSASEPAPTGRHPPKFRPPRIP